MPHRMVLKRTELLQLIEEAGHASVKQFCEAAALDRGTVSKTLSGKLAPGVRFVAATSYTLNVPVEAFINIEKD